MKAPILLLLLPLVAGCMSKAEKETLSRAQTLFKPVPQQAPALKHNPATTAKAALGKTLFFDPRLSTSQLISCNTCHNLGLGGADLQETSIGHRWQKGPRNAPTVYNAVFDLAQFWDGRAKDLQTQAKGPVQAPMEMNSSSTLVETTLKSIPGYATLFREAFPGEADPVTFDNMARAIEVFEASLVTPDARFDRFLKGEISGLHKDEMEGLRIFMDKGCASCHGGINLGGAGYYPFGVMEAPAGEIRPAADTGRFKVTNTESDRYVFKAPSLRNVAVTQPYFHSGKVSSLQESVAVMGTAQLGVRLTEADRGRVVAFLGTLTGRPPKLIYPELPPSSDRTPRPNWN